MGSTQLDLHTRWRHGAWLSGPEDEIPDDALRLARNCRLDRISGAICSRPGMTQLSNGQVDAAFQHGIWISKLFGVSSDFAYAQMSDTASSRIYRLNSSWQAGTQLATGLSTTPVSDVNWVDGSSNPWKYLVGPTLRKDNGTSYQTFGIAAPTQPPTSATLGARGRVQINSCDSLVGWVGAGGASGLAAGGSTRQEGSNSLTFSVASNSVGSIGVSLSGAQALTTGTHTGGSVGDRLIDSTKNFGNIAVRLGSIVRNTTDGCEGRVTQITTTVSTNDTLIFAAGMTGGTTNNNKLGDVYEIYFNLDTFQPIVVTGTDNSGVDNKTTRLVDTTTNFVTAGVTVGMVIWNLTNGADGIITSISTTTNTNDTLIFSAGLTGSSENDFDSGDGYRVFNDLVKLDDWVHLYVRADLPDRIEYMQIDLDLDTTTLGSAFVNNFQSLQIPGSEFLNKGRDQWTELFLRKSQFTAMGRSAHWVAIRAIRVSVRTTTEGAVTVYLDDISHEGGYGIEGDITYTAIYRNSTTGGRSAPPKDAADVVLFTTKVAAKRQPITVSLSNIASPSDSQVNQIRLYRKGGTLTAFTLVETFASTTTVFVDTKADSMITLNETLENDNDPPSSGAVAIFGPGGFNRLFILSNRNRLYFSKAWQRNESRGENFPLQNFVTIGDGSQEAMNGIALDQTIFVWTEEATWQVIGQGEDAFLPLAIPQSRGLVARFALAQGDGQVFFLSNDGIYSQVGIRQVKLTGAIDPFFMGQTVNGHLPINTALSALSTCRMAWYPHPQGAMLVLLYPESGSSTPNRRMVLKKSPETGAYTECFFDDSSGTAGNMRAVYSDPQNLELAYSNEGSRIYRGEVDTANTDDGNGLQFTVQTKAFQQGLPRHTKTYLDLVVEANTGSANLIASAFYNKSAIDEAPGNVSGSADSSQTLLTLSSTALRRNLAVRLTIGSSTNQVRVFKIGTHYIPEAEDVALRDTDEITFPTRHVLRHLFYDVDATATLTVTAYVDGTALTAQSISATSGRQRVDLLYSNDALRRGLTFRVTTTSSTAFRLYDLVGVFEPEPQQLTFWDSREVPFELVTALSRYQFDIDAPAAVTVTPYVDGTAQTAITLAATTNRQRRNLFVPAGLKGRSFRVTLSSSSTFQLYGLTARVKAWGQPHGYREHPLTQTPLAFVQRSLLQAA